MVFFASCWFQIRFGAITIAIFCGVILLTSWFLHRVAKNLIRYRRFSLCASGSKSMTSLKPFSRSSGWALNRKTNQYFTSFCQWIKKQIIKLIFMANCFTWLQILKCSSLFFLNRNKTDIEILGSIFHPLKTILSEISKQNSLNLGKSGTFWKRNSSVSIGRRVKIQKPLNLSFCSLQLFYLHLRHRSKVKVTFSDPGTFKFKFEYERMLLGNFWYAKRFIIKFNIACENITICGLIWKRSFLSPEIKN